jgi:hypothetical protein
MFITKSEKEAALPCVGTAVCDQVSKDQLDQKGISTWESWPKNQSD